MGESDIPGRYHPGDIKAGKVTKLTNFGVFVELEPGLEGLLHISELADHKVETAEEVVKVGDEIEGQGTARRCGGPQDRPQPAQGGRRGAEPRLLRPTSSAPDSGGSEEGRLRGGTGGVRRGS